MTTEEKIREAFDELLVTEQKIISLAKDCGFDKYYGTDSPEFLDMLVAFYHKVQREALEQAARELKQHNSHWEAWYLKQRAAGVMPTFDEAVTPSNA